MSKEGNVAQSGYWKSMRGALIERSGPIWRYFNSITRKMHDAKMLPAACCLALAIHSLARTASCKVPVYRNDPLS